MNPMDRHTLVDHIDGQRRNNRRENLRYVTFSGNAKNMKLFHTNTSGVNGLSGVDNGKGCMSWTFKWKEDGRKYQKYFPYNPDGYAAALLFKQNVDIRIGNSNGIRRTYGDE